MAIIYNVYERESKIGNAPGVYQTAMKQRSRQVPMRELATLISERCTVSRTDVVAVLDSLGWAVAFVMRNGSNVQLPFLGSLFTTIRSKAIKKGEEWKPECIKGLSVRFRPTSELKDALTNVQFERSAPGSKHLVYAKTTAKPAKPTTGENKPTPGGNDIVEV